MSPTCLIRKSGNLVDLSTDGKPLTREAQTLVEDALVYTFRKTNFGNDRRMYGPVTTEQRPIFMIDTQGRHVFGAGCVPRIKKLLVDAGYEVQVIAHEPKGLLRPDRYRLDWDLLMEHFCDRFRPKQQECVVAIATNDCGRISAPPGFGKGEVIKMAALLMSHAKIDVAVPGKDLVKSLVERLSSVLPDIGQVGAGKKYKGRRITVYSADSLHLSDGNADVLLVDEIHRMAAPSYASALAKYKYSRNYGFSANVDGRFDGADMVLEALFGPVIFEVAYQEAAKLGLVAPIRVEWLSVQMDNNPCAGKSDIAKERWGIWRNSVRNKVIAAKALSYDEDDQVLIMVRTLEHALYLRKHLPTFELCYSEQSLQPDERAHYISNGLVKDDEASMTPKLREQMRRDFTSQKLKRVIATGVWSTGVDFVNLPVLIRADAQASEIADTQIPGRVCRTSSSKDVGVVVDLGDQFDEGFRRKALTRKKHYEAHGWKQVTLKNKSGDDIQEDD